MTPSRVAWRAATVARYSARVPLGHAARGHRLDAPGRASTARPRRRRARLVRARVQRQHRAGVGQPRQLLVPTRRGRHHRQAGGERLELGEAEALVRAGADEHVGGREPVLDVAARADEVQARMRRPRARGRTPLRQPSHRAARRPGCRRRRVQSARQGRQQRRQQVQALLRPVVGHRDDYQRVVRDAQLAPHARARAGRGRRARGRCRSTRCARARGAAAGAASSAASRSARVPTSEQPSASSMSSRVRRVVMRRPAFARVVREW